MRNLRLKEKPFSDRLPQEIKAYIEDLLLEKDKQIADLKHAIKMMDRRVSDLQKYVDNIGFQMATARTPQYSTRVCTTDSTSLADEQGLAALLRDRINELLPIQGYFPRQIEIVGVSAERDLREACTRFMARYTISGEYENKALMYNIMDNIALYRNTSEITAEALNRLAQEIVDRERANLGAMSPPTYPPVAPL